MTELSPDMFTLSPLQAQYFRYVGALALTEPPSKEDIQNITKLIHLWGEGLKEIDNLTTQQVILALVYIVDTEISQIIETLDVETLNDAFEQIIGELEEMGG